MVDRGIGLDQALVVVKLYVEARDDASRDCGVLAKGVTERIAKDANILPVLQRARRAKGRRDQTIR